MDKEFIPYELALELRQLGFDEPCFGYYEPNKEFKYINWEIFKDFPYLAKNSEWGEDLVAALTYSQAFRWFRVKGIENEIHSDFDITLGYNRGYIPVVQFIEFYNNGDCYETHEEAELECLKKLIEIVKEK